MNTIQQAENQILHQARLNQAKDNQIENLKSDLHRLKSKLESAIQDIEFAEVIYTGWSVLLKRDGSTWKAVGCIDALEPTDDDLPDFDLILSIPQPEGTREWEGG